MATASNPTYAKKATVAPVSTDLKPFGAKGDQFEVSTSKAPTMMTTTTIVTYHEPQKDDEYYGHTKIYQTRII